MNIGFDAKRAYHNDTGLGNYSRTLIRSLARYYPQHEYFLFNTKSSDMFPVDYKNVHEVRCSYPSFLASIWRTKWVTKDIRENKIDLYHGLSHEIPVGINKTKSRSVVTIHDLIHERYPEQYAALDRKIYTKKYKYACEHADRIIAVSKQTKKDLIDIYNVPEEKIRVCYQSCDERFGVTVSEEEKQRIRIKYGLPEKYFLSVGSIIERKNLLSVCKAMLLNGKRQVLAVIGDGKKYKEMVLSFLEENGMLNKVIFLSEGQRSGEDQRSVPIRIGTDRNPAKEDFPAIYQAATAMIYPSTFEGFGIPVLEALFSRIPVITSNVSCLPEAGGDAAFYVDPLNSQQIADAMNEIENNIALVETMKEKGWIHAQHFTPQHCAAEVMNVYKEILCLTKKI